MKINLRYRAYKLIKEKIIFFDMKPGRKIVESDIAKELEISRTPVREALLMLESEKLIVPNGKAGYFVRKISLDNASHYYRLRVLIETFAANFIFENIKASEIKLLAANLRNAEKALNKKDLKEFIRYETEFHQILYESSRSEVLIETLIPLADKFHWLRSISVHAPNGAEESLDQHVRIYESIKSKDIDEYKRQIELHFEGAESKFKIMQGLLM